jgi:hypothetical protein
MGVEKTGSPINVRHVDSRKYFIVRLKQRAPGNNADPI